jgi:hypothetical protein
MTNKYNMFAHNCDATSLIGDDACLYLASGQIAYTSARPDLLIASELTICQRMYLVNRATYADVLNCCTPGLTYQNYMLYFSSTDIPIFAFTHAGGTATLSATTSVSRGHWNDIVVRSSVAGVTVRFNINGAYNSVARGTANVAHTAATSRVILGKLLANRKFEGYIKDLVIYDRCLTDDEVKIFERGGIPHGFAAYWPMGEATGLKINDWSHSRNNLKMSNGASFLTLGYNPQKAFIWG